MKISGFEYHSIQIDNYELKASVLNPVYLHSQRVHVMLHGGGIKTEMSRFFRVREKLAKIGIRTISFDFLGHGLSNGELKNSSLAFRTKQALAVLEYFKVSDICVWGFSMGAYNAVQLLHSIKCNQLILLVPAVYSKFADNVYFGPRFSEIIRKPDSWLDSNIWTLCNEYQGEVMFVTAQYDEVVSKEISDKLISEFRLATKKHIEYVCEHSVIDYFESNEFEIDLLIKKCVQL